jgi:hypothetical protein
MTSGLPPEAGKEHRQYFYLQRLAGPEIYDKIEFRLTLGATKNGHQEQTDGR